MEPRQRANYKGAPLVFHCTGPLVENLPPPSVFCPLIWALWNWRSFKQLKWILKTVRHQHLSSILLLSLFKTVPQNRKVLKDNFHLPNTFSHKCLTFLLVFFYVFFDKAKTYLTDFNTIYIFIFHTDLSFASFSSLKHNSDSVHISFFCMFSVWNTSNSVS